MVRFVKILILLVVVQGSVCAQHSVEDHHSSLLFTENNGQWDDHIKHKAEIGTGQLYLEENRLTFSLIDPDFIATRHAHGDQPPSSNGSNVNCHAYQINFLQSLKDHKIEGIDPQSSYRNYFTGNDKSKWASHVKDYKKISYQSIYNNIDFNIYGDQNHLKYDYVVAPMGNPANIKMEYEGVDDIYLKSNKLRIETSVNDIEEQEPYAFQLINNKLIEVPCNFTLTNRTVGFNFPEGYDTSYELIIDPTLVFSSYSGSTSDNWGFTATYDDEGNLYGGGVAFDMGYPTTTGAFQTNFNGSETDISVSKFTSDGSTLLYSTYIGGDAADLPHSLVVNKVGQLVILGTTSSSNYPVSVNAFDDTFNGGFYRNTTSSIAFENGSDIIVTVLNKDGDKLAGSTYVGGSNNDGVNFNATSMNYGDDSRGEVFVDQQNNIYVGSITYSDDFPTTANGFSSNYNGGQSDGCIFKMSFDVSTMIWSNYLGGSQTDAIVSLKVNTDNTVIACGYSTSNDLGINAPGMDKTLGGTWDGIAVKISENGSTLLSSTYLGENQSDRAYFIDYDTNGDVFVLGQTNNGSYPISNNVFSVPGSCLFVQKLDKNLQTNILSTVIGNGNGNRELSPSAFMIDRCNRLYISGWGGTTNFGTSSIAGMPISSDAFQPTTDGSDFYFCILAEDAVALEYGTYFGGGLANEHVDGGTSRFDKTGTIYQAVCAGCQGSDDFPTTPGAYSNTNNSTNCNLGVIKFDFEPSFVLAKANPTPAFSGCVPASIEFTNFSIGATEYNWDFGDGTISMEEAPNHTYTEPGNYVVRLVANNFGSGLCNSTDTAYLPITIISDNLTNIETIEQCEPELFILEPTFGIPGASYLWQDGSNNYLYSATETGIYWVETNLEGCINIDSFVIEISDFYGSGIRNLEICEESQQLLQPSLNSPDNNYIWSNGQQTQNIEVTDPNIYWVQSFDGECFYTDSFQVSIIASKYVNGINYICEGESFLWEDKFLLNDTTVTITQLSAQGCDSTFTMELIVQPTYLDTILSEICINSNFELPDGTIIEDEGYYTSQLVTDYSCDSIIVSSISFLESTTYINVSDDSLTVLLGESVDISVTTNVINNQIEWTPPTYLDCDDCLEVTSTPYEDITYAITGDDENGCETYALVKVYVDKQYNVYIPNVFTPGQQNGNSIFQVFTDQGAESILFLQIYDRWGDLVYDGHNLTPNAIGEGWDGYFRGELVDPAVFTYLTKVLFYDGNTRSYTGDVTVVR